MFNFFFRNAVYDITWKNIVRPDRRHMTVWSMRFACCVPKDTNAPSEYVILTVFPLQQWLRERAWVLPLPVVLPQAWTCTDDIRVLEQPVVCKVSYCFNGSSCSTPLYFMTGAVFEPRPGTNRYYPPLVFHAFLEVLTPSWSRLGCESSSRGSGYHASIRQ
jgi:hypothetical protein